MPYDSPAHKLMIEQAVTYIEQQKSFRLFENECDIPANLSPEIWSIAAQRVQQHCVCNYRVSWTIELDAPTKELAAQMALKMMRGPGSTATFFDVTQLDGEPEQDVLMVEVEHGVLS